MCPPQEQGVKTENDHINLKVAGQDGSVVQFKIKRYTPLSKLMKAYCERQGLQIRQIRFRFDGQPINENDTPAQLEMEDEDTIDVDCHAQPKPTSSRTSSAFLYFSSFLSPSQLFVAPFIAGATVVTRVPAPSMYVLLLTRVFNIIALLVQILTAAHRPGLSPRTEYTYFCCSSNLSSSCGRDSWLLNFSPRLTNLVSKR
uniref:Small ubiquitin like modifier 3b n=1 Tax=Eptatretus burgeri TaxID=7764 RepID=A0A8C4PWJ0_EPTBU